MSQFIEMFGNPLSSKQKNELKRLGQCCIINPRRPNIALCDTDKVSFIPMPAVSEDGYLVDMADEEYGKVKKGFTYFENNDVLFAKITPCMENGKGAIAYGLTNGIGVGSTEFHVLRPINGISSPYWLLTLTRMPIFRERAAKNMSGTGGQKRVSASYLNHFMVGLPAIEEQRRFEAIYKQADKSKFGDFKSQFIEMFGNVENKPLVDVCIKRGEYGSNTPADDYDGNIRYVRITDITEEGNLNNVVVSPRKIEEKYMLLPGDLLFARTGNTVGKTYLHKSGKMIFAGYLIRYRLNKELMLPQFALAYTHTNQYYDWVEKIKKVGAQPNISAAQFDLMPIPVPTKDEQTEFVTMAEQADKSKSVIQKALVYLNDIQSDELKEIA